MQQGIGLGQLLIIFTHLLPGFLDLFLKKYFSLDNFLFISVISNFNKIN